MEQNKIVNGVNQSGKAAAPEDQPNKAPARKPSKGLADLIMGVLSAFAQIVSPIKEEKDKQKRRR
jgi:hypothetical protein